MENRRRSSRFASKSRQEYPHDRSYTSSSDNENEIKKVNKSQQQQTPIRKSTRKRRPTSEIQKSFREYASSVVKSVSFNFKKTPSKSRTISTTPLKKKKKSSSSNKENITDDDEDVVENVDEDVALSHHSETESPASTTESDSDSTEEEEPETDDDNSEPDFAGQQAKKLNITNIKLDKVIMDIKRQTALPASPGSHSFSTSFTETYNHESYLLANNRLKFKAVKNKIDIAANDSRKGRAKKPRKGTRGLGGNKVDNLPVRGNSNFSVTKETVKASETCLVVDVHDKKHETEILEHFKNNIVPDFPRWMSFMWEGFNVVLHGFGSKTLVVNTFTEHLAEHFEVFTINGLCPKLSARKILSEFVEMLKMNIPIKGTSIDVISDQVCKQLPNDHAPIFIIVPNFDTLAMCNPNVLTCICSLVQISWIHLLATTDTVNASIGVTQSQSVQLNFCWIPCSTFQPFIEEFKWTPNIFGESSGSKGTENTLQYVLKSLTGNARKAFSILASLQLSKLQGIRGVKKSKEFMGIEFSELARKCKDNFIAHNDGVLKTLLVEFVDHKLITNHQGKRRGVNLLTVDLDVEILQKIVKDGI